MADFRLTTVLSMLVLLHGFLVYVCQSCSPPVGWRPPTLVDKILDVPNVLYGLVRETYPDERFATAYTVELEVYCILKGATTPLVINITQGGYVPALCESSNFLVNHTYIARAQNVGEAGQPLQLIMAGSNINTTEENLKEITKACGLNPVTRPPGFSSKLDCPVSAPVCQSERTPYVESSASATIVTVATTTLAAAAALVLNKIIK